MSAQKPPFKCPLKNPVQIHSLLSWERDYNPDEEAPGSDEEIEYCEEWDEAIVSDKLPGVFWADRPCEVWDATPTEKVLEFTAEKPFASVEHINSNLGAFYPRYVTNDAQVFYSPGSHANRRVVDVQPGMIILPNTMLRPIKKKNFVSRHDSYVLYQTPAAGVVDTIVFAFSDENTTHVAEEEMEILEARGVYYYNDGC